MAKITKSVRMSEETLKQLEELNLLLKEGMPDLIERAVDLLYEAREDVYEQEDKKRRSRLKPTD